jgi:Stress responsive A/B Barrel Domain
VAARLAGMSIQHIFLMRFDPELNDADEAELRDRIETSSNAIGRMSDLRFAPALSPDSARGYQYLASMVFATDADLKNYMVGNPIHHELYEWAVARNCEFLVLDYDLDAARALKQPI